MIGTCQDQQLLDRQGGKRHCGLREGGLKGSGRFKYVRLRGARRKVRRKWRRKVRRKWVVHLEPHEEGFALARNSFFPLGAVRRSDS